MTEITTAKRGQTLVITFNRPEKMNALTRDMYAGLAVALNEAAGDFSIRAVVLTSAGEHFTAGNDIKDFMANPPTEESSDVARFLGALLEFPKPLVAAVKGNAVGVGTTMLLHSHRKVFNALHFVGVGSGSRIFETLSRTCWLSTRRTYFYDRRFI